MIALGGNALGNTLPEQMQAKTIYSTINKEELKKLVKQEKITYILYEEGMEYEQQYCREETIASVYKLVYETEDGRIRIYET